MGPGITGDNAGETASYGALKYLPGDNAGETASYGALEYLGIMLVRLPAMEPCNTSG